MPSPVGHEIAGLLIFDLLRNLADVGRRVKTLSLCLLVAILPDFDFIPGIIEGEPNKYHHGSSHSIFIGLTITLILTLMFYFRDKFWIYMTLFFSIYLSHLVLDLFSLDQSYPYGLKLLWPFSTEYFISPQSVFADIRRVNSNTEFVPSLIFNSHNLMAVLREVVILTPPVIVTRLYSRWRRSGG
jgi:inner membrane protein